MVSVDVKHYVYLTFPTCLSLNNYILLSSHLAAKHVFISMNQAESNTFSAKAGEKKDTHSMKLKRKYIFNQSALNLYTC